MTTSRSDWDMWDDIALLVEWLDSHNELDDHELTLRILKLSEEVGEVAEARINQLAQNPRKGRATKADVGGELCDVIVTAAVALTSLLGDPTAAKGFLAAKLGQLRVRAGVPEQSDGWKHVTGKAGAA